MLDAKWSIDKKSGAAFKAGDDVKQELFDELEISGYRDKVLNYLLSDKTVTNHDLVDFGLAHNFLPKHTKAMLDELKKKYTIDIISLDGDPASSYYLGNEKRVVNIQIKS